MQLALTAGQMKNVDVYMMQTMGIPNIVLMENAARGVYEAVKSRKKPCTVHVYCGVGNNGGDGLAAARILLANGYDVYVIVAGEPDKMTPDTLTNFAIFKELKDRAKCIKHIGELNDFPIPEAEVVIDALLGTGLTRRTEGLFADLIEEINSYEDTDIISVDVPSGVQADTGAILGNAVKADVTITFQHPKVGLYIYPGKSCVGELQIAKIGIDEGCEELRRVKIGVYDCDEPDLWIRKRRPDANKGDFGRLLLIAGSEGMAGAAVMAAQGASRAGAGLVTAAAPKEVVKILQLSVPQATCAVLPDDNGKIANKSIFDIAKLIKGKTAVAVGPGLGGGDGVKEITENLLCEYEITKVFDADAINALRGNQKIFNHKAGNVIITPHPAEFARILNRDVADVLAEPIILATEFAKQYKVIVVLKGATTIIADPKGNARLVCGGTPGMAKGGSGDVLTGIIAGLAAQGKSALESALLGVIIAAAAGERAAERCGEYSMTPLDELNEIGAIMKKMETDSSHHQAHERRRPAEHQSSHSARPREEEVRQAVPVREVRETKTEVKETRIKDDIKQKTELKETTSEKKITEIREPEVREDNHEQLELKQKSKKNLFKPKQNNEVAKLPEENAKKQEAPVKQREELEETVIETHRPTKDESLKTIHGGKTAEQALAEIKAKEESEMQRASHGLNEPSSEGMREIKKESITEIIDLENNGSDEPTPPKKPTSPTRRRIG